MNGLDTYVWNKQIASYEVDRNNRLRLSAILRLMQESGDRHTEESNVPIERVLEQGCMVLISRSAVQIHRYPIVREILTMTTLHRAIRGVRMYRDFIFCVGQETVIEATNEYFCADLNTRRVVKPDVYLKSEFGANQDYSPNNPPPKKIILPEQMVPAGERTVYESFVDRNGHMNNSYYCDFALDAIAPSLQQRPIKTVFTSYQQEALPQSTLSLYTAQEEERAVVCGKLGKTVSFSVEFGF